MGDAARSTIGRAPDNIVAMRPLKEGVVTDFEATTKMLSYFIRKVQPRHRIFRSSTLGAIVGPKVVICVSSGVTDVELKAVRETVEAAGARRGRYALVPLGFPEDLRRGS